MGDGAPAAPRAVEHLVLFKIKAGEAAAASAMVSALAALESLPGIKHLHVGPRVEPPMGQEPGGAWTHALYGRYDSKDALAAYSDHPDHVAVVAGKVKPIAEEVLALDWEVEAGTPSGADKGAGVIRVCLMEVSDADAAAALGEQMQKLQELEGSLSGVVRWMSAGKNFAPARAKGHTWGALVAFSDEASLSEFESSAQQKALFEEGLLAKANKFATIDFKPLSRL